MNGPDLDGREGHALRIAISDQVGGMLDPRAIRWRDELRREARPAFLEALVRGRELELWDAAAVALADDES